MGYTFVDRRLAKIDDGSRPRVDVPLLYDPGERFTYGPSTAVLGLLVEKVSGRRLDEFVKARIFDPLGMADTSYAVPPQKHDRVVTLHARDGAVFAERTNPATIASNVAGDGGLLSTAADYGRLSGYCGRRRRSIGVRATGAGRSRRTLYGRPKKPPKVVAERAEPAGR